MGLSVNSSQNSKLVAIANSQHTWFRADGFDVDNFPKQRAHRAPKIFRMRTMLTLLASDAIMANKSTFWH